MDVEGEGSDCTKAAIMRSLTKPVRQARVLTNFPALYSGCRDSLVMTDRVGGFGGDLRHSITAVSKLLALLSLKQRF